MISIDLNNLDGIPKHFLNELKKYNSIFLENEFMDGVLEIASINNLMLDINQYCKNNFVIGYHYTRADKDDVLNSGLQCRNGIDIRTNFILKYGPDFTKVELQRIQEAWENYFNSQQQKCRDNRLFFNFTLSALKNGGAEPLLLNFGGEQVYMPLQDLEGIGTKIKNLGTPLILKCRLNPNQLNTFYEYPWGRIAISTYHSKINPHAFRNDQDGYQDVSVMSENIEIIEYDGVGCNH